uniref:Uncharacterized protein n=1 Tax=Glossina austeni TaxID=7395 RepID=A0A1A9VGT4_GLOAU
MSTSVTVPNILKYSLSFSADVCQLRPPTNNLPGAGSDATEPLTLLLGSLQYLRIALLPMLLPSLCNVYSLNDIKGMIARAMCYESASVWPMIIILKVAILGITLWTVRTLFTRDDFVTYNQKYEIPPGLMKAYMGGDDEEEQEE